MIKIDHLEYVELPVLKAPVLDMLQPQNLCQFSSIASRRSVAVYGKANLVFLKSAPKTLPEELSVLLRPRMRATSASAQSW